VRQDNELAGEEVLKRGKALLEPARRLSRKDFKTHIKDEYQINDDKRAKGWIRAAKRFGNCPELVRGLCETNIVTLARPTLEIAGAIDIIKKMNAREIKSDTRSVKKVVNHYIDNQNSKAPQGGTSTYRALTTSSRNTSLNTLLNTMIAEQRLAILRIEEPSTQRSSDDSKAEKTLRKDLIAFLELQRWRISRRYAIKTLLRLP
jgi:hypothetical protein